MITTQTMAEAYADLCVDNGYEGNTGPNGDWGDQGSSFYQNPVDIEHEPIVLIETSPYGQVWITLHRTLADACRANTHQEYAEDWMFPKLYDLRRDKWYEVEYRATAVPVD